jgi:hypothetical protein
MRAHGEREKRAGQRDQNWRRSIRTKGMNALWQAASEYVKAQHPPDKKERDCRDYDVANLLLGSLWLGAIGHGQRIAPGLAAQVEFAGIDLCLEKGDGYFYFSGADHQLHRCDTPFEPCICN